MALVTRYFSTTSAGAGDGTTWADRAALFSAGVWSTIIKNFAFNGSDAMEARIGPGTYTCGAHLVNTDFANPPTAANFLILHGADSSGNRLTPPDPDWVSAQPAWDDSSMPVIATTTNVATLTNLGNGSIQRLLKFTATGRTSGNVAGDARLDWCVAESSASGTSVSCVGSGLHRNCVFKLTGTSYDTVCTTPSALVNCRIVGNSSASSGNRRGLTVGGTTILQQITDCTVITQGGPGIFSSSGSASASFSASRLVVAANTSDGILFAATASQTITNNCEGLVITGNGGYGINGSAGRSMIYRSRLRDNTSGNFTSMGNHPEDMGNDVSSGSDAVEFVDAAGGDYRIKYGSAFWGKGIGAGDGPATITG